MKSNGKSTAWYETEAGKEVQARLTEERTLKAIDHLLSRIDTLETAVDRLTTLIDQGPGLMAMTTDMADEVYRQSQARGVSIEERLANALQLAEKLTSDEMVGKIENLIDLADQAPGLAAMTVDMADEMYRQASASGVSIEQHMQNGLQVIGRLTEPKTVESLNAALDFADQLPGMAAMTMDMLDEGYKEAAAKGLDLGTLSTQGIQALKQVSTLVSSPEFKALMDSGLLSPATISVIASAGDAMVEAKEADVKPVGAFGTLRALSDPDRQKAIGFLMNFLKHWGQKI